MKDADFELRLKKLEERMGAAEQAIKKYCIPREELARDVSAVLADNCEKSMKKIAY